MSPPGWVETNLPNIRIFPMEVRFAQYHEARNGVQVKQRTYFQLVYIWQAILT